ncbi:zinc transport system ATP-binding protein [Peptostreptococcus russellii]|uniref:Zinc transport system ATP-binding protein n=1 Tax=Peptostreptococcus russellii TaxID=215200 RepID=A0A1H8J9X6_9FIRM|nr:metal ABC transporter ATP-binding protein [Peptostreptococcus russellii]SEN77600.1 zinc transport system ATP-binding protein [Peptostreptococcus russellii]
MKKIIEVKNVSFKYDRDYVFENINFDIYKGDFVGIIGSNGAGKSTLIKLILGQLKADKGKILIDGVESWTGKNLQEIGYVPQVGLSRGIDFPATVEEIVMMNMYKEIGRFGFPKKEHKEKVKKALEIVDMTNFLHRKFSDLSGGQQQRVVIAKAIVNSPEILILDEPTTGIDHHSENVLYELLDKLHKEEKITIVMISHDIEKIKAHSNKLIRIEDFEGVD